MTSSWTDEIITVIKEYERAVNDRDTVAFRRILALGDDRFREIEDHIPVPIGSDVVVDILQWMDEHPDFEYTVEYRDIQAFLLSENVAYAVTMNDWQSLDDAGSGRATFVMIRNDKNIWQIIHGHWSAVPPEER